MLTLDSQKQPKRNTSNRRATGRKAHMEYASDVTKSDVTRPTARLHVRDSGSATFIDESGIIKAQHVRREVNMCDSNRSTIRGRNWRWKVC